MLNLIWVFFFLSAFIIAVFKFLILGDNQVFPQISQALFDMSDTAFDISIGLTGVLCFWLGIMKIGERSGMIQLLTKALTPLFSRLMPEVPPNHPALASIVMNISANALGLDNAATPMGIKAMKQLQTLNPEPDTASNAQILFLVINTSAVTLFPVTIFTYRAQLGAANPTDVFIPILISTYMSTLAGFLAVGWKQRINMTDPVILSYLAGLSSIVFALLYYFSQLSQYEMLIRSAQISHITIYSLIIAFIATACFKKINAYEAFIEGAQEGFQIAIGIIPYLVAMLVALGVFRASGALDLLTDMIKYLVRMMSLDDRFVDGLPTALMKPFSGSGARAMMLDSMQSYGADSFVGRLVCIVQGSTETTFYVLAVYFGSIGIKNIRHAASCGIIADFSGILAAILVTYWFFN